MQLRPIAWGIGRGVPHKADIDAGTNISYIAQSEEVGLERRAPNANIQDPPDPDSGNQGRQNKKTNRRPEFRMLSDSIIPDPVAEMT